jgi:hypothetical protein
MIGPIPLSATDEVDFSWFLAAYVTLDGGPFGNQLARELMPDAEPGEHATLVYPTLIVTLFMREVMLPALVQAKPENAARLFTRSPSHALAAVDPCGAIAEFLDELPAAVEDFVGSLVEDESSAWGWLMNGVATISGKLAYAGAEAARGVLRHLPGVDALRTAASVASAVSDLRTLFTNWELTVDSSPGSQHKPIGGSATGQFVLTVASSEPDSSWPAPLQSCAELLDIPLPDFNGANDSTVTWTPISGFDDPVSKISEETVVAENQATFTFGIVEEDAELHVDGVCELVTRPVIEAQISLPGLENLGSTLAGLMGAPAAQAAISASAAAAANLLGPSQTGTTEVKYHARVARVDFDGPLEQIHLQSDNGIGPDSTWTGTWGHQTETTGTACGAADVEAANIQFSGGTASLSLSFMQSGGVMEYCAFSFTQTLTILSESRGCYFQEDGAYTGTIKPPDPGAAVPTSGTRDGSYVITPVPEY